MQQDIVSEFRSRATPRLLEAQTLTSIGDLVVEVRSPADDGRTVQITVDIHADEVIVAFGGGHSHGGDWRAPDDPDYGFAQTFRLLSEIFDEQVVGYSLPRGGGGLAHVDAIRGLPRDATIRSWRGALDRH